MKNNHMKQMMRGALLLSLASFIAKILSAVYRVPFQNMVGNTGFYVYQQVYPIYGIGMTFALSGFPVFFSKMIAETPDGWARKKMMRRSMAILGVLGVVIFAGVYVFARQIAAWMGDSALQPILESVSWMFLLMPLLATLRGYFQGTYRMEPTAVSQVLEQLVRVGAILIAAYLFKKLDWDIYEMGAKAMSGATIGAIMASMVLLVSMRKDWSEGELWQASSLSKRDAKNVQWGRLIHRYATEGLTICLLSSILVLFQLLDSFTLYNGLLDSGVLPDAAKSLKGIYDRGQPLVQLGMVVGTGFSASFIPMMSQAHVQERELDFVRAAKSLLRMTATFSAAAVTGLLAILPNVNHMLFGDREGTAVLAVYVLAIFVASVMTAYHSILQSLNQYAISLVALGAGLATKMWLTSWFVERWGTLGASYATVAGLLVMLLMLGRQAAFVIRNVWMKDRFIHKLAVGCALLYAGSWIVRRGLESYVLTGGGRMEDSIIAILTVFAGVGVFVWYILKIKLFTLREWITIPFGKKLLRKFPG
jgi:O-antigen/teichoic acid export membrane protein